MNENADEIVKALRNNYAPDIHVMDDMNTAADLIESLQSQLTESQRRERAAVEDLKLASDCSTCDVRGKKGFSSCAPLFVGGEGSCKNYKWRGPQEAGKGEAK